MPRPFYRLVQLTLLLALTACSATRPPGPPPAAGPLRVILDGHTYQSRADRKARALVVVDGQPSHQSILDDLAPSNIDSVRMLKPGPATARYGPEARHGALLIYTKKGRK